ncbi:MAG: 50S ribosomal protein L24 [Actinomycetaceae bacterium]|nr:50S ribosomal protein L24 [Actinomycetaceae bacterium]
MPAKIKKGDTVMIIAGGSTKRDADGNRTSNPDLGQKGTVLSVDRERGTVIVEGRNLVKRHTRAGQGADVAGGIETKEAPIAISNVALVAKDGKPVRVGFRQKEVKTADGSTKTTYERIGRRGGKEIEL